ncbi:hypothetical protein JRO89_XS12G0110900 [Xanthoceras sorbifolium]|uniref:Uncharacterized protein n=1 Tax=Xanthoceras sorbifolium TaxID=99658 RepID=A0ABQ8HC88_9ROSI|nr:hypothetical protein JRO89_XS12G0110900 [Xanthoceras sorbifolium]
MVTAKDIPPLNSFFISPVSLYIYTSLVSPTNTFSLFFFPMEMLKSLSVIVVIFVTSLCAISNNGVEASHKVYPALQSLSAINVKQVHRTAYHFQPPKYWINGTYAL